MYSALSRLWRRGPSEGETFKDALRGAGKAGVSTFRASRARFSAEVRRARRYERPLAVLAIEAARQIAVHRDNSAGANLGGRVPPVDFTAQMEFFLLGALLHDSIRETDLVAYSALHHVYAVMLPEAGEIEARLAVVRLENAVFDRAELRLRAGVAEFPGHGLTVDDLFAHAREDLKSRTQVGHIPLVRAASHA